MIYKTVFVHIDTIRAGDTVIHEGDMKTVCKNNLKYCSFMGITLWGDSYKLGYKKVEKVIFNKLEQRVI